MVERATAQRLNPQQSFIDATSWSPHDDHRWVGEIDPVWSQGRAVYGGVVGAGIARAMGTTIQGDRTLRSFAISFVGPVESGTLECATERVREGRSVTFTTAKLVQSGTVRATATATFAGARESSVHLAGPARPDVAPPDSIRPMPYVEGIFPSFTQRLEFRYTHGEYPFSGVEGSSIGGWCRFRHDDTVADAPGMLALIDGWPAPALQTMNVPAPASSVTWNVDLCGDPLGARLDDWWYFDARTVFAADGYTSFEASLWAPDGRYMARSSQLVGIFD